MKVRMRRKRITLQERQAIATDYNSGIPTGDIRLKYRIGKTSLYRALKKIQQEDSLLKEQ